MEPMEYLVVRLDGDYALLRRTDIDSADLTPVARARRPRAFAGRRLSTAYWTDKGAST